MLGKYLCELATFANILINFFKLGSIILDIVGESVFYLTSLRVAQVVCENHGASEQSGRIFALLSSLYAFSIVLGYAISYGTYGKIPLWTYLIILTSMTVLSGAICYFGFPMERRAAPTNQLNE